MYPMLALQVFSATKVFRLDIRQLISAKHFLRAFVSDFTHQKRRINDAIFMAGCVPRFRYIRRTNPYG